MAAMVLRGLDLHRAEYQGREMDGVVSSWGEAKPKRVANCNERVGYNHGDDVDCTFSAIPVFATKRMCTLMMRGFCGISDWVGVFLFLATCAE